MVGKEVNVGVGSITRKLGIGCSVDFADIEPEYLSFGAIAPEFSSPCLVPAW